AVIWPRQSRAARFASKGSIDGTPQPHHRRGGGAGREPPRRAACPPPGRPPLPRALRRRGRPTPRGAAPPRNATGARATAQRRSAERIDAVVLSGGSAFGLDAGAGVQALLRERGRGFAIGDIRVPLVCGASMFDLLNGGDKNWGRFPPYRDLGYSAAAQAGNTFTLGTIGAGF